MKNDIPAGATPQDVQGAMPNPPQGDPQGATPAPPFDSAARIAELERDLTSANSRISVLNGENATHRRDANAANSKLTAKETEFAEREKAIELLLKRGKDVSEINAFLDERETLLNEKQQNVAAKKRDMLLNEVVLHGRFDEKAFKDFDAKISPKPDYVVVDEKVGNKTEKAVKVRCKSEDGKEVLTQLMRFLKFSFLRFALKARRNMAHRPHRLRALIRGRRSCRTGPAFSKGKTLWQENS